jgi:hypothetical protein
MDPAEGAACCILTVPTGSTDTGGSCGAAVVVVAPLDWTALATGVPVSQKQEQIGS